MTGLFCKIWLCFFCTIHFLSTVGQQQRISGFILNEKGDSLAFSAVKFKIDSTGIYQTFCIANAKGYYRLLIPDNIKKGVIEAAAVGCVTKFIVLEQVPADTNVNIILSTQIINLPEIFIRNDLAISVSGDTISFRADAFKYGNERNLGELLKSMPGFVILDNGKIIYNGKLISKILIEDDDLTGKNYEQLVNNLAIKGIEKVQVIRNYTDLDNIVSKMNNSGEQGLNIKFKKKFLGKVIGNGEGASNQQLNSYDINGQAISLLPKAKAVMIGNLNTSGVVNEIATQFEESESGNQNSKADDVSEISLANFPALVSIDDIGSAFLNKKLFYANRLGFLSANYKFKFTKKLFFKGSTTFAQDQYSQQLNTSSTYFMRSQIITVNQAEKISKKLGFVNTVMAVNYLIDKRNQMVFVLKSMNKNFHNSENCILENVLYKGLQTGKSRRFGSKITYNYLMKKAGAITFETIYQRNSSPASFQLAPPGYDSFFYNGTNYDLLQQEDLQLYNSWETSLKSVKKNKSQSFLVELRGRVISARLANAIEASTPFLLFHVQPDSVNNIQMKQNDFVVKLEDVWKLSKSISVTLMSELIFTKLKAKETIGLWAYEPVTNWRLLPGINADFHLSPKKFVSFSLSHQQLIPSLQNIANGYVINGLRNIGKGDSQLHTGVSRSVLVTFSHIDLIDKGVVFFSSISYNQVPLLYLGDMAPNRQYAITRQVSTQRTMSFFSVTSRFDKFLYASKTKITPQFSLFCGSTYSRVQQQEIPTNFTTVNAGLNFATTVRNFRFMSAVNYFATSHRYLAGLINRTSTKRIESSVDISYKFRSRLLAEIKLKDDLLFPPQHGAIHWIHANAKINLYSKNEKWEWGIACRNILNQNSYSYSIVSQQQLFLAQYRLFPRLFLASVKIKF